MENEIKPPALLESINSIQCIPLNFKFINVIISEECPGEHVDIIKVIEVELYRTDFFKTSSVAKPISKIIDFTPLLD